MSDNKEQKDMTGVLFMNSQKKNKQPDMKGSIIIEGKKYNIAAWGKVKKTNGEESICFSLAAQEADTYLKEQENAVKDGISNLTENIKNNLNEEELREPNKVVNVKKTKEKKVLSSNIFDSMDPPKQPEYVEEIPINGEDAFLTSANESDENDDNYNFLKEYLNKK